MYGPIVQAVFQFQYRVVLFSCTLQVHICLPLTIELAITIVNGECMLNAGH